MLAALVIPLFLVPSVDSFVFITWISMFHSFLCLHTQLSSQRDGASKIDSVPLDQHAISKKFISRNHLPTCRCVAPPQAVHEMHTGGGQRVYNPHALAGQSE